MGLVASQFHPPKAVRYCLTSAFTYDVVFSFAAVHHVVGIDISTEQLEIDEGLQRRMLQILKPISATE